MRLHFVERAGVSVPVAGENTVNQLVAISSSSGSGFLQGVARVVVGQAMSYSPLLVPLLVIGLARALRRVRTDDRDLFVTAFTWPVLLPLLAAMVALKDAEQHWTMVAFIPAAIAAGRAIDDATGEGQGAPPAGVRRGGAERRRLPRGELPRPLDGAAADSSPRTSTIRAPT